MRRPQTTVQLSAASVKIHGVDSNLAPGLSGRRLRSAATVVSRLANRRWRRRPLRREQPPHAERDTAEDETGGTQKSPPDVFGGTGFSRTMAQARHAVPTKIGDPGGDEALRHTDGGGGIGDGPSIDDDALHDPAALCRAQGAGSRRLTFHTAPTPNHRDNSPLLGFEIDDDAAAHLALQNLWRQPR
jgi:hypothetical protein